MTNYFKIHKNKKPKKLKYSKPYTKEMLSRMKKLTDYFIEETRKLNKLK